MFQTQHPHLGSLDGKFIFMVICEFVYDFVITTTRPSVKSLAVNNDVISGFPKFKDEVNIILLFMTKNECIHIAFNNVEKKELG